MHNKNLIFYMILIRTCGAVAVKRLRLRKTKCYEQQENEGGGEEERDCGVPEKVNKFENRSSLVKLCVGTRSKEGLKLRG